MEHWQGLISKLIYIIQFEYDPLEGTDRALNHIMKIRKWQPNKEEYIEAIEVALKSNILLSDLIPQPHTESIIRSYLKEVLKRIKLV